MKNSELWRGLVLSLTLLAIVLSSCKKEGQKKENLSKGSISVTLDGVERRYNYNVHALKNETDGVVVVSMTAMDELQSAAN